MSYNSHRIPPPRTFSEEVEECLSQSGGKAKVIRLKKHIRTVILLGDYADRLLAKKEFAKREISIE